VRLASVVSKATSARCIEGDAFGLKGRETLGDDVGIYEFLHRKGAHEDVGGCRGFARAVGASDDYEVGTHESEWSIVTRLESRNRKRGGLKGGCFASEARIGGAEAPRAQASAGSAWSFACEGPASWPVAAQLTEPRTSVSGRLLAALAIVKTHPPLVLKSNTDLVVPPSVRRQAGIQPGHQLEFKASRRAIAIKAVQPRTCKATKAELAAIRKGEANVLGRPRRNSGTITAANISR
jgi:hypothetical protein